MCGKDSFFQHQKGCPVGSPPRVRERLCRIFLAKFINGITPACAGKTVKVFYLTVCVWDHPRVCGKDVSLMMDYLKNLGSPPRVRERRFDMASSILAARITPACAGKTF